MTSQKPSASPQDFGKLPHLHIGNLDIRFPVIQGGMGIGVSLSGLAAAVARAGGVGVIATAGIGWDEPDYASRPVEANQRALRRHIRLAKENAPGGIIGVNIMVALTDYDTLVSTSAEEGVDIIFSGAGLPLSLPEHIDPETGPKLAPIVSSGRAAQIICKKWLSRFKRLPDALVVEGPMAGGHLGFKPDQVEHDDFVLEKLLVEVIEATADFKTPSGDPIPVIAAGGVYTGADIRRMLDLGAAGCQMGTRFVATNECDAAPEFKQRYVDSKLGDITVMRSPLGLPGRAIKNIFLDNAQADKNRPEGCAYRCMKGCRFDTIQFCISEALINAKKGKVNDGLLFAGANAWRVEKIIPVAELVASLAEEYKASEPTE
ncbi:NAD(P)H-dependent flavin oxidoreductase [Desulfovibrio inopinatus]|uniref:NAD(P)H-dependent flavin oxidoreductase n=1 Tax=Desulfovibrio inopinatus TaxID=102109 RepID=UPI000424BBA3|nr:nitronate monooxygenase family protein [Desulfovibrio inopinatus]